MKIFLTAAAEERARRRLLEYEQKGIAADFDQLLQQTIQRDEQDRNRAIAPLRQAEDALLVDTTHLSLEQAVEKILTIVKERLG